MRFLRCRQVALALAAAVGLTVIPSIAFAQRDRKQQETTDQAQRQEINLLVKLVDAAMAGQPAPSDIPLSLRADFLKAQEGKTYVPYMLLIEPGKLASASVGMYLRVVPRGMTAPPAEQAKKDDKKKAAESPYSFEDIHFVDVKPAAAGEPQRVARAFAVPGGDYDVYVALKERAPGNDKDKAAATKLTVVKQPITVPNYWTGELMTSSIILADRVEPITAPLSREQQADRPYALGNTEIVPAADSKFTKKEELSILFLVYNAQLGEDKKPDIQVEYNFHQKLADGEKYFNKTNPQSFSAQTLPPQFDVAAGHQIVAGQSVPLGSFPDGEYRLEVTITDKLANKSIKRDIVFSVVGS